MSRQRTKNLAVGTLTAHGLLPAEGSEEADRDEQVARHREPWAPDAAFLHYGTRHDVYPTADGEDRLASAAAGRPRCSPPVRTPTASCCPGRRCRCAPRSTRCCTHAAPIAPSPAARCRCRSWRGCRRWSWPVDYIDAGGFRALFRRTSPQGGARQEIGAYVGIRSVDGAAPGWYHCNGREHSLELIAEGCTGEEPVTLCGGQAGAGGAGSVVVLAARFERMSAEYGNPRAYRVCLLDAGHLGQTFALTATALGLSRIPLVADSPW